jgi:poly(beta-D-mannuronate) lyase
MKNLYLFAILIASIFQINDAKATTTTVNTLAALTSTFSSARPGDTIIVANGRYNWGKISLNNIYGNSTSNWIVLKAQTNSGVIFTDSTYLMFSGNRILVNGFKFANGNSGSNAVISFRTTSSILANYSRLSNIVIDNYNTVDTVENEWVGIFGVNNRLDHCNFYNKSNPRSTVVIWYSNATFPDRSVSTYHRIDSNYFKGRSYMGGNGGESIRVGVGNNSRTFGYNVIEYNLFEGLTQAEPEIVSNKSYFNTYRYNTFKNCNGGLTLRMGKYCTVYGNFFINNDSTKTESYGVRIIDKGHKVFNNYFEGLLGTSGSLTSIRCPIITYNGTYPSSDSLNPLILNGAYLPADSALIANNTIVNCPGGPGIKIGNIDAGMALNQSKGTRIANNVIKLTTGQAIFLDPIDTLLTYTAEGNLYSAPSGLGLSNNAGFTSTTLTFGSRMNGILSAPANVQDAAVNTAFYNSIIGNLDAQGQTRSAVFDAGCDELNGTGDPAFFPLDSNLVGAGKPIIIKQNQTITFPVIATKYVNDADFNPGATTTSGLTISLSSSNTAVASIVNGNIHIIGAGTSIITASQAGNIFYNAAVNVSQTLTVQKLSQTISFAALPAKAIGDSDFTPTASASSGLAVSFTSSNTAVATIVGGKIHIVGAGTSVITASQAGNTTYNAAANVSQTLTVTKDFIYPATATTVLSGSINSGTFGNLATNNSSYYVVNSTTSSTRKVDWYGRAIITTVSCNNYQAYRQL